MVGLDHSSADAQPRLCSAVHSCDPADVGPDSRPVVALNSPLDDSDARLRWRVARVAMTAVVLELAAVAASDPDGFAQWQVARTPGPSHTLPAAPTLPLSRVTIRIAMSSSLVLQLTADFTVPQVCDALLFATITSAGRYRPRNPPSLPLAVAAPSTVRNSPACRGLPSPKCPASSARPLLPD